MTSITNPNAIKALQLRTALRAIRLEAKGMTRRGRSVTAMYKDHYGLSRGTSRLKLIEHIEEELKELEAASHV